MYETQEFPQQVYDRANPNRLGIVDDYDPDSGTYIVFWDDREFEEQGEAVHADNLGRVPQYHD